jgi:hypothetical protein
MGGSRFFCSSCPFPLSSAPFQCFYGTRRKARGRWPAPLRKPRSGLVGVNAAGGFEQVAVDAHVDGHANSVDHEDTNTIPAITFHAQLPDDAGRGRLIARHFGKVVAVGGYCSPGSGRVAGLATDIRSAPVQPMHPVWSSASPSGSLHTGFRPGNNGQVHAFLRLCRRRSAIGRAHWGSADDAMRLRIIKIQLINPYSLIPALLQVPRRNGEGLEEVAGPRRAESPHIRQRQARTRCYDQVGR